MISTSMSKHWKGALQRVPAYLPYLIFSRRGSALGRYVEAETTEKVVALNDDGQVSLSLVRSSMSSAHDAIGTFFMVGRNIDRSPEVVRRVARSRHELGNHSYRHQKRQFFAGDRTFLHEIEATQQRIEDVAAFRPLLFRPPWLYRTPRMLRVVEASGMRTIGGEFCHVLEIAQPDGSRIAKATLRNQTRFDRHIP